MSTHLKHEFFDLLWRASVLQVGDFILKSGRRSPYFFNFGHLHNGPDMLKMGELYAKCIAASNIEADVLFGPAYKGIYLASATACGYQLLYNKSISFASNRKEAKTHGEGGVLLGAPLENKKVLIIDDVVTQGTALSEVMPILKQVPGLQVVGLLIAIDRQEKIDQTKQTAKQKVEAHYHIPVHSIATLADFLQWAHTKSELQSFLPMIDDYVQAHVCL